MSAPFGQTTTPSASSTATASNRAQAEFRHAIFLALPESSGAY
jgi:hypothetical protein